MDDLPLSIPTNPLPAPAPGAPDPNEKPRVALAAGLALLWGIFTLLAQISGALDVFEDPLLDWRLSLNSYPAPPSDQLALIAIDTIPSDHPWPWSRLDYSLVLRSLIDYAPQSVVFEMNLNDRDTEYASFDDTFSHIVQRANTVVFAATVLTPSSAAPLPAKLDSLPFHGNMRLVPRFGSAIWPLDTFAGGSPVGVNNLESEAGLRLRRIPLVFMLDGKMIPSLVLQAAIQLLGADPASSEVQIGRAILLRRKDGRLLRTIPIDDEGRMRIRYHQDPVASWQASWDNILLYDDQIQHGITPDRDLRGLVRRQVWIGRTDPGERERFKTAVGPLSRVEVQLQAERTILDQDYVRPLPPMILAGLYLLICIGGAVAVIRFGALRAAAMLLVLAGFWFGLSILAFWLYNVILPMPSFAMLLFGACAMGILASRWDLDPDEDSRQLPLDI
ncbi:MAG TPA: CHASE2 domain-containing protein [Candidatus Methylacidiphilales bacterium]|nr:CHASE2 domain-containing protein [Candidatus Methylacidiphilales bacterium]